MVRSSACSCEARLNGSGLPVPPSPVAGIVAMAVVARRHPIGTHIRRTRPIAGVPDVARAGRIPIAADPDVTGARTVRPRIDDRSRRRCVVAYDRGGCIIAATDAEPEEK